MTRLTFASLAQTLSLQDISLTGKSGKYIVESAYVYEPQVFKTLSEVKTYTDELLSIREEANTLVSTIKTEVQTEPTEAEVDNIQYVRAEQLFNEIKAKGIVTPSMANTTNAEDEELMGKLLVQAADKRRENTKVNGWVGEDWEYISIDDWSVVSQSNKKVFEQMVSMVSKQIARGFATNTPRVSAKLQRRANKFFANLPAA